MMTEAIDKQSEKCILEQLENLKTETKAFNACLSKTRTLADMKEQLPALKKYAARIEDYVSYLSVRTGY